MSRRGLHRSLYAAGALAAGMVSLVVGATPLASAAELSLRECRAPNDLVRFTHPLPRTAQRLEAGEPLKIVAIGSSSTAGVGASSPDASYPSRLAANLRQLFPHSRITILNRGVNGEDAREMVARFPTAVIAEKPDLVLWQVGTNAVLRDDALTPAGSLLRAGLRQLKATGADVVLIDPQFAPKVIAKPEIGDMIRLLSASAKEADVDVFARFAIMRNWHEANGLPFEKFVTADGLHMNDWGYACVAKLLGASIADAAERTSVSAHGTSVAHHIATPTASQ